MYRKYSLSNKSTNFENKANSGNSSSHTQMKLNFKIPIRRGRQEANSNEFICMAKPTQSLMAKSLAPVLTSDCHSQKNNSIVSRSNLINAGGFDQASQYESLFSLKRDSMAETEV